MSAGGSRPWHWGRCCGNLWSATPGRLGGWLLLRTVEFVPCPLQLLFQADALGGFIFQLFVGGGQFGRAILGYLLETDLMCPQSCLIPLALQHLHEVPRQGLHGVLIVQVEGSFLLATPNMPTVLRPCFMGTPRKQVIGGWPRGTPTESGWEDGSLTIRDRSSFSVDRSISLISMSLVNFVTSECGILQASHPGSLIAMVSKSPASFISPISPNLLPVNCSATFSPMAATSISLLHPDASRKND